MIRTRVLQISLSLLVLVLAVSVLLAGCSRPAPTPSPSPAPKPPPVTAAAPKPAPSPTVAPAKPSPAPSPKPSPKPAPAAKTYNWKFQNVYPLGSPASKIELEWFGSRVAELSKGRINIKYYSPGELAIPKEFPDTVRDGIADMAYIYMPYHADIFPIYEAFSLPFMFKTYEQAFQLTREFFGNTPEFLAPLAKYKLQPLWYTDKDSQIVQTRKPIRTLAELKGLKLRTAGGMANVIVETLGAVPVALMIGEAYQAIQSGLVDGTFTSGPFQEMYKWYEVAPNFLVPASLIMTPLGIIAINSDLWKSLSKEDQEILNKAALEQEDATLKYTVKAYWEVLDRMKTKGGTVRILTDAETDTFKKTTRPAYDTWLKQNPGGDALIKRMEAWVAAHPPK